MTAAVLDALNESFETKCSDGSLRVAISGTFSGTLTLYVKDATADDSTYRVQKTYTAATAPDSVLEVFGPSTFKLQMTAYTSGSAICDMRVRAANGGGANGSGGTGTITSNDISDSSAAGRTLLTAPDASAQRTALGLRTMATQNANAVAITGGSITGLTSAITLTPLGSATTPEFTFVGDTNTGMRRSAANVLNLTTDGSDAFRIDANQRTLLASGTGFTTGAAASVSLGGNSGRLQVFDFGAAVNNIHVLEYVNAASSGKLAAAKSRSTSVGTFATVNNGDAIFDFDGYGDDGTAFINAVKIRMDVSGAPSTGSVPGRLRLQTGTSSGTLADGIVITPAQRTLLGTTTDDATNRLQVNGSITVATGNAYKVNNVQVVTARQAAITAPTGGLTQDTEARTAINTIISRLQTHGLIS